MGQRAGVAKAQRSCASPEKRKTRSDQTCGDQRNLTPARSSSVREWKLTAREHHWNEPPAGRAVLRSGAGTSLVTLAQTCLALAGCVSQNFYTTPRTVGARTGQVVVAPQFTVVPECEQADAVRRRTRVCDRDPSGLPALHVAFRRGIGERGEVAVVGGGDLWGLDAKWNAVRTEYFDLALLARLGYGYDSVTRHDRVGGKWFRDGLFLHVPIMFGLNLGPVTLVASPGYVVVGDTAGQLTHGLRAGAGLQIRFTSGFAIMPEASVMHDVYGPARLDFPKLGLGFIFPNLPGSGS